MAPTLLNSYILYIYQMRDYFILYPSTFYRLNQNTQQKSIHKHF